MRSVNPLTRSDTLTAASHSLGDALREVSRRLLQTSADPTPVVMTKRLPARGHTALAHELVLGHGPSPACPTSFACRQTTLTQRARTCPLTRPVTSPPSPQ